MEIIWLALAFLSLGAGLHKTFYFGFRNSYAYFIIFIIALVVFYIRREKRMNSKDPK